MTAPDFTPEQWALWEAMSDLSEEVWCAGWLGGIEYELWTLLLDAVPLAPLYTEEDAARLRGLSEACGGWIAWPRAEDAARFVPLEEWRAMFDEWLREGGQGVAAW